MLISIVNKTKETVSDEELQHVIRAINRQINEDFAPYWHLHATLRLEGRSTATTGTPPDGAERQPSAEPPARTTRRTPRGTT